MLREQKCSRTTALRYAVIFTRLVVTDRNRVSTVRVVDRSRTVSPSPYLPRCGVRHNIAINYDPRDISYTRLRQVYRIAKVKLQSNCFRNAIIRGTFTARTRIYAPGFYFMLEDARVVLYSFVYYLEYRPRSYHIMRLLYTFCTVYTATCVDKLNRVR